jgi:plastocyanin
VTTQQRKQSQRPSSDQATGDQTKGERRFLNVRWRFLWLSLAVLLLALAACSDTSSAIGRYHQGRTLHVNVMSIDRVPELRYSTIDPEQVIRRWSLTPSANDTELVLVRMKVENHTAISAIVNVDRAGAELRDFSNGSYFPLSVEESVYRDLRAESEAQIRMSLGQCFDPNRVMIDRGTELEWTNEGDVNHFVQFNGAQVLLGGTGRAEIAPSASFSHTFGQAGAFDYNCGTTGSPPETAQVLVVDKSSGSGVRERSLLFLEGPFELPKGFGIDGWMVFEVPEGTQFRDIRWRAGDSITVRF